MQHCSFYATSTNYRINCEHQTAAGFCVGVEPFRAVSRSESPGRLGEVVLEVLAQSNHGVPNPSQAGFKELLSNVLKFVGARSWRAFVKSAACCGLRKDGNTVTVVPYSRDERYSYSPLEDHKLHVSAEPIAVGEAIKLFQILK